MATKKKRKCPKGFRRDGKCRTTKCPRKLTKKRLCPKGASSGGRRKKAKKGKKPKESKLIRALRAEVRAEARGQTPRGMIGASRIGMNRLFGTRRAAGAGALERMARIANRSEAERKLKTGWTRGASADRQMAMDFARGKIHMF